jgi:hypothetical protein
MKDGKAEERKLSLGQTFGAQRQVLSGIAHGRARGRAAAGRIEERRASKAGRIEVIHL